MIRALPPPIRIIALVLALVLAPSARAARWYTVEAIVFEPTSSSGLYAEAWPDDPGRPPLDGAVELRELGEQGTADEPAGGGATPGAFVALSSKSFRLQGIVARFRRSGEYRTLLHVAWRQPGYGARRARPVHLHAGPALDYPATTGAAGVAQVDRSVPTVPVVDGTLRLYVSRFLHLDADLLFYRSPGTSAGSTSDATGSTPWVPTLFRLRESRRMRLGELHYLDNPMFGMLVEVTPYDTGTPDPDSGKAAVDASPGTASTGTGAD